MIVVSEIFLPLHPIKLTNNCITKFTFSSTFSLFYLAVWNYLYTFVFYINNKSKKLNHQLFKGYGYEFFRTNESFRMYCGFYNE